MAIGEAPGCKVEGCCCRRKASPQVDRRRIRGNLPLETAEMEVSTQE